LFAMNIKKTIFAGFTIALLALPFVASAATINDLQTELQGLLAQISSLQAQGSASASVSANTSSSLSGTVVASCPSLARSLSLGSTGSDVSALQAYLDTDGYLSVSPTGYFGLLTKAAVGKWQAASGITTSGNVGFGVFGPLSRSFFLRNCGGTTQSSQPFSADPQSGTAPLTVTFTTSDSVTASSSYSVDFGDGTSATAMTKGSCIAITAVVGGQGGIRCSYTVDHTYSANGTYTAKLLKQPSFSCPAGLMCAQTESAFILPAPQVVATTQITVGTSTTGSVSFTASPTSGAAPLTVQFTATAPQGTTLGNTVNFGDGSTGTLGFVPVCSSCNAEGVVSHTYASAGTYTATLTNNICSCPANGICNCPNIPIFGTATVTVSATSTAANIQQLNAPGSVTLQQNGIAEIRNENYYFTLDSLTSSSATIQLTQVGCWNSFPSDTPPMIRCMIAVVPIPPLTLSIGQTVSNYPITLTQINGGSATFSVSANPLTNGSVSGSY
jgi:PKD repeat protein